MGLISPTLPTIGQPFASEAADVGNALTAIVAEINGGLDAANIENGRLTAEELAAALLEKVGVSGGGATRRGKSIIAAAGSRTNVAYGALSNGPDVVSGIVLPTDGLIVVAFQALWRNSVAAAGRAAIFIGANQLVAGSSAGAPNPSEAGGTAQTDDEVLASSAGQGLITASGAGTATEATTGQLVAAGGFGGPAYIFAAAGTYDVSVQFKASSGSVTVSNRKLWVWSLAF